MVWAGLKWRPVLKVREQLQDKHSQGTHNPYRWKPLAIFRSNSPRVQWLLLTFEEIECENSILFFFLLSSCSSSITQKVYGVYKRSAHRTNALLSEIILILVRGACQLRWVMAQNTRHGGLLVRHFVHNCTYTLKTKGRIRTLYLSNNCSNIGNIYSLG